MVYAIWYMLYGTWGMVYGIFVPHDPFAIGYLLSPTNASPWVNSGIHAQKEKAYYSRPLPSGGPGNANQGNLADMLEERA